MPSPVGILRYLLGFGDKAQILANFISSGIEVQALLLE